MVATCTGSHACLVNIFFHFKISHIQPREDDVRTLLRLNNNMLYALRRSPTKMADF